MCSEKASIRMATVKESSAIEKYKMKFLYDLEQMGSIYVIKFCMQEGLISKRFECTKCSLNMQLNQEKGCAEGYRWLCRNSEHQVKRSVRKGSWFAGSKLTMIDILKFTYLWICHASYDFIGNHLNMSRNTIYDWSAMCRKVCEYACKQDCIQLGGEGKVIEIYECKFRKLVSSKKKEINSKWMICGTEVNSNKCFIEIVPTNGKKVLLNVIRKYVLPGTIISSDCWATYNSHTDVDFVYLNVTYNLTFRESGTKRSNKAKSIWDSLKKNVCMQEKIRLGRDLDSYLMEFMWRRSQEDEDYESRFKSFLAVVVEMYPPAETDYADTPKRLKQEV